MSDELNLLLIVTHVHNVINMFIYSSRVVTNNKITLGAIVI